VTKKETNLSGTLSEAVSVATSVAYTRQEIQKLKTELVSLLEKKTTEVIVEQVPGPVGPRGALGATGAQGPKGDKGDKGDVGERGEKGDVGLQGEIGPEGLQGINGDKGDKGEKGDTGEVGPQGIQGIAGEIGPQGLKGDRGEDGKNGLDGRDGKAGAIGPSGSVGTQGIQGERGLKGDRGERGQDGKQGIQGSVGPRGEIGPQGIQGLAGKDGKDADIKPVEEKFQKFIDNVQKDVSAFKTKVNAVIVKSGGPHGGSSGSGEVNLRYLDDVDRDSITDGYVLSYDSANAKFTFVEQGGGDGTDQWARDQANAAYNYANTLALESGTLDTTARARANSAWYTANLAYVTANSAWATANSALNQQSGDLDLFARSQANSAFNQANISYTVANNSWSTANASYIQANTALDLANSAFAKANTGGAAGTDDLARSIANSAFSTANASYIQANTGTTLAQAAYNYANTISLAGYAVNTTVNLVWSTANNAYAQANSALSIAQSAFAQANTGGAAGTDDLARSIANSAFSTANTATTNAATANNQAASAFSKANTATTLAQSAYDFANTIVSDTQVDPFARSQANSAFNQANTATSNAATANSIANSAFNKANTGTSQLVNGDSTVSLSANGNLTVAGPISGLGNSKLDFTTYGANTAYLTTTSDDSTALFMGLTSAELYANTTVQIRTNTAGVSNNWTFGVDGTLTFPDATIQTTAATNIDALARSIANSAFAKANTSVTYNQSLNTSNTVSFAGVTVTGNTTVQHVIPSANVTYDLGTSTARFRDLYLSGNTINLGSAQISANGLTLNLPAETKVGNKNLSFEQLSTITKDVELTSSDNGLNLRQIIRYRDLLLSNFSSNTISSLSSTRFSVIDSISEPLNTNMICDNERNIVITLPSANSVSVGFSILINRLNSGDITVENASDSDIIRYGGWKFDTFKMSFMKDRQLSEFSNSKLTGIANLHSYPVSEFADKYTVKYTCISSSSYMLSI